MESEKGQMKKRLWEWGRTVEVCCWKKEEIGRLTELLDEVWEETERETENFALQKPGRKQKERIERLEMEITELLQEKDRIDEMLERLTTEEKQFVMMRFEKGYGFDFIAMKMHMGRATLFRMQDRILKKLMEMKVETL